MIVACVALAAWAVVATGAWLIASENARRLDRQVDEAAAMVISHQDAYAKLGDQYAELNMEHASARAILERQLPSHEGG